MPEHPRIDAADAPETDEPLRQRLAALFLLAVLTFLRKPSCLLYPQPWAEDGSVFLAGALRDGFLATLAQPYSGYLHALPRLAAGLALWFPLELAPLVLNTVAFAVQVLPAALLLSPRMAPHLGALGRRTAAAALLVAVPDSYESYVNVTNSQWHLALAVLLLLFMDAPRRRLAAAAEAALAGLGALTGPFALLLAPIALLRWRFAGGAARRRLRLLTLVLVAGAAVQGVLLLGSPRGSGAAAAGPIAAADVVRALSTHLALNTFLGIAVTQRLGEISIAVHAAALLAVTALATSVVTSGVRPLQALLFLAGATVALAFLFPLNPVQAWLDPRFGPRYFTLASLALSAAAVRLVARPGPARLLGVPLTAALLVVGVPLDFPHREPSDTHWREQIAAFRSRPAGARVLVPLNPLGYGGMVLPRDGAPPVPFSLPQLPASNSPLGWGLSPPKLEVPYGEKQPVVDFAGLAWDVRRNAPAAAVYLIIDGVVFPAIAGRPPGAPWNPPHPVAAKGGFRRRVPLAEIGRGWHTVTAAVVGAGRDAWIASPRAVRFEL